MPRIDSNLVAILRSVRARLMANVSGANNPNCYIALDPMAIRNGRPGDFVFVVSPFDGSFGDGEIDGGGQNQATTIATVAITVHSIQNLDRPDEDGTFLSHGELGLIQRFEDVLAAFLAQDLVDESGNEITYEPIIPTSYNVGRERDKPRGWMQLVMNVKFDWDLS